MEGRQVRWPAHRDTAASDTLALEADIFPARTIALAQDTVLLLHTATWERDSQLELEVHEMPQLPEKKKKPRCMTFFRTKGYIFRKGISVAIFSLAGCQDLPGSPPPAADLPIRLGARTYGGKGRGK